MKRSNAVALAIAWTIGILVLCMIPGRDVPQVNIVGIDKVAHVILFAVFGILWLRTSANPTARTAVSVVAFGIFFGIAIEIIQHLQNMGRMFDPFDAVADAVGVAVSVAIVMYIRHREHGGR